MPGENCIQTSIRGPRHVLAAPIPLFTRVKQRNVTDCPQDQSISPLDTECIATCIRSFLALHLDVPESGNTVIGGWSFRIAATGHVFGRF